MEPGSSSSPYSPEGTEQSRSTHLDVNSGSSLPRVDSTASFVAEACHIEDVDAGCQMHSHPSDTGLSRHYVNGDSVREDAVIPRVHEHEGHLGQREENKDSLTTQILHGSVPPESHSNKWTPPAISISDANHLDQSNSERPDAPAIVPPPPQFSIDQETGDTLLPPSNRTTLAPGPDIDASQSASGKINWGFDDMSELLKHETGELTREVVQSYGEQQGRAISPIDRTSTPPAPPKVVSKPELDPSSDEDEEGGTDNRGSPFRDDESAGDDAAIFNSIFSQAGAGIPGCKQEQPNPIFDSVHVEASNVEGSDFFNSLGASTQGGQNMAKERDVKREEVQAAAPSFFDEPGDYEGGDFFSTRSDPQPDADDHVTKSTIQSVVVSAHYGGVAASTTTAISEFFGTTDEKFPGVEFFANPAQGQGGTETNVPTTPGETVADIAAKWKAALAADELLDDDFLPDDEDFLSTDEEEDSAEASPPELMPVVNSSGVLQGFTNVSTSSATPTTSRYAPQTSTPPINTQGPYKPPQQQYGIPAPGWQSQPNPYTPVQQRPVPQPFVTPQPSPYTAAPAATGYYTPATAPPRQFQAPPPKPSSASKAQSFVDKKGSYQSPYDLPLEVVKPALSKRVSMPQMSPSLASPPPRQSSFGMGATPPISQSAFGPPLHNTPPAVPAPNAPPPPPPKSSAGPKPAFFEELPVVTKVKPSRYQPQIAMARSESLPGVPPRPMSGTSPAYQPPLAPAAAPYLGPAPVLNSRYAFPQTSQPASQAMQTYVTPPKAPQTYVALPKATVNAPSQYPTIPPTPPTTSHYTSAPPTVPAALPPNQGLISPPQLPPYQRVPSAPLPNTGMESRYAAKPAAAPQQSPPSQRQVSSPLIFNSDGDSDESPKQHSPNQMRHFGEQHNLHSSRPGTAKSANFAAGFGALKEEDEPGEGATAAAQPPAVISTKYGPKSTAASPPLGSSMRGMSRSDTLSPPSRTASPGVYSALQQQNRSRTASPESFAPPRRAQTQSPSTLMNGPKRTVNQYQPSQHTPRPASALAGNATSAYPGFPPVQQHTHSMSAGVKSSMNDPANFMPPQDTSVKDPLNRWQGCPIFSWGFGGHVVIMFPTRTQRNAVGMSQPIIKCSPGEVKIRNTRDVLPLEDSLAKFPGPVYTGGKGSKSKKKEVLTWMTERIAELEREANGLGMFLPGETIPDEAERKRNEEKILLWKGMKAFLENDGVLEGPEIEKSIRTFLWPENSAPTSADSYSLVASMNSSATGGGLAPVPDRVNAEAMKTIRTHLLNGDRTAAVWHAVDKRLWSHAMLIAGTVSNDLWKQVVQDFVRNEVKVLGGGLESLAVLYEIFGGNGEESVDELVPQSARLGQPMMTSITGTVSAKDPLEGLEKWRETLALIMSNRSAGDTAAIAALGKLLATYSRVEAAHLCYLFAKNAACFSGSDDPKTTVALFGADHLYSPFTFWKDTDAMLLSEVYELAMSLAPAPAAPIVIPHLQGIKVYHAFLLAESGYRTEAHKYCDAIGSVLKTSTKPSPYFHRTMFNALEELTNRVSQSPKDAASSGWLSKPSLDNISGSMWGAFTKFVAGDDNEPSSGTDNGQTPGPFGGTSISPGMSRTQSSADLYGSYGGIGITSGNYSPTATKQYTPAAAANPYTPPQHPIYSSQPPGSGGNSYDPSSTYSPYTPMTNPTNSYKPMPTQQSVPQTPYAPASQQSPYMSQGGYEQTPTKSTFDSLTPYQDSFQASATNKTTFNESSGGYQPPSCEPPSMSYGYEPPTADISYQPQKSESTPAEKDEDSEGEKPKPKKKSFMDDDDDDAEFLARAATLKKQEEEKKKKEEEEKKQAAASGGSGWFKGWFGGKKDPNASSGPIKAKLGEESSFYYDPDLKRWINKKAAVEDQSAPKGTPPPPKRPSNPPSRPGSAAPPPQTSASAGPQKSHSVPLMNTAFPPPTPGPASDTPSTPVSTAPPMRSGTPSTPSGPPAMRAGTPSTPAPPSRLGTPAPGTPGTPGSLPPQSASAPPPSGVGRSAPPSRPSTAVGGVGGGDILDDLLGGPVGPRKGPAAKKGRKGGRYVDVMAK